MEKRVILGVQKRKKPIKRNKKPLLKKVVDYLLSDSYMFAPLIFPPLSDFLASKAVVSSSTSGVELKENLKGKSLVEKVGGYLKSESYFYAPLLDPQQIFLSKGADERINRARIQVYRNKLLRKSNKSTVEGSKVTVGKQLSPGQGKLVHKETVKHMVYQSCRSSSVSGERTLNSTLRSLVE